MKCLIPLLISLACSSSSFASDFPNVEHLASQSQIEDFSGQYQAAPGLQAREITDLALSLIMDFEGWEPKPYNDPSRYCTIGYGHLIALKPCESLDLGELASGITPEKGKQMLEKDTRSARIAVNDMVTVELNDDEFSALSSLVFNIGKKNFSDSTLLVFLNDNLKSEAADQFKRWIRSKKVILPGLVSRRSCEKKHFEGQLTFGNNEQFQRSTCQDYNAGGDVTDPIDIEAGE
ncbi:MULTISPECIES: lysozyme [unclassified Rhizobium]|uniref:lysozyme n=1 Tax=unclassified Rhizobium TaxID=2613769 RepID=UPI0006F428F2|nr:MULTISPECIES: lysozyme [unclassified Rhizobium]KQV39184.1 hypothetical protein ASC86_23235 [Rhizobium sp. Root1212]KRD35158.1 hypothetical protein ASE37_21805 [Rhizobium sp. Root268]